LQAPEIIFSEWYAWDNVKSIPRGNLPGLYIIAQLEDKPQGLAQPNAQKLIYIGETHGKSQSIHKRLNKFFKASQIGGMIHKHSGGNRFNRVIGNDLSKVYAAGFAPILEDKRFLNPFIFYSERKLIWEHLVKWSTMPTCNGY